MSALSAFSPQCQPPSISPSTIPINSRANSPTFHTLAIILAALSVGLSTLIAMSHVLRHLLHCTKPAEQKVYIRIILLPPTFGIFYLFSTIWYGSAAYISQLPFIYEAVCVCSLFDLFIVTVAGSHRLEQEKFFQNLERWNRRGKKKHDKGSLRWFKYCHWAVYQFPVTCVVTSIADILNAALVCETSKLSLGIKVLVQIFTVMSTITSLGAFLRIYRRLRLPLRKAGMVSKFVALKLMVLVVAHERFVFNIVVAADVFTPTATLSLGDFSIGMLALIVSGQMVFYSLGYLWAFRTTPFRTQNIVSGSDGVVDRQGLMEMEHWPFESPSRSSIRKSSNVQKVSFLQAYIEVFNWSDLFKGTWISFKELRELVGSKKYVVDSCL